MDPRDALAAVIRDSRVKLLACLAGQARDLAAAEDALAEATGLALLTWPNDGVPDRPEAWLLVAARRRLIDAARKQSRESDLGLDDWPVAPEDPFELPDKRLALMFVCAHPAIDASIRPALMLQVVLGMTSERIASAFVLQPATLAQRLSRAKAKIRAAGIPFEVPDRRNMPERLDAVLEAIYGAFAIEWDECSLADESLYLARLLNDLLPEEPEPKALLALLLYSDARHPARRGVDGCYVPLSEQDVALWSAPKITEAEALLRAAAGAGRMGRYQFEAAIQSVHSQRRYTRRIDWHAIVTLYAGLIQMAPALGALVSRAAALAEAESPAAGWAALEEIPADRVRSYQPWWAVRADLLRRMGRKEEAVAAYDRAIGLSGDEAVRAWLRKIRMSLA